MDIELTGVDEMKAKLLAMRQQLTGPSMEKAVRAGANVIKRAMVERTPELIEKNAGSNALEPGAVKRDIKVRFPTEENQHEVAALIGPGGKTSHVARWVEYGHRMVSGGYSKVGPDGRVRGPGKAHDVDVPAYPFLRPAFEESVAGAKEALVETMRDELQKAAK